MYIATTQFWVSWRHTLSGLWLRDAITFLHHDMWSIVGSPKINGLIPYVNKFWCCLPIKWWSGKCQISNCNYMTHYCYRYKAQVWYFNIFLIVRLSTFMRKYIYLYFIGKCKISSKELTSFFRFPLLSFLQNKVLHFATVFYDYLI